MGAADVRAVPGRIEELLDSLDATGDPAVRACADELVSSVATLYGTGLERVVAILAERPDGERLIRLLCADDLVANLLLLHDLHPDDVDTRIQRALDKVRPYLGSHAGGIDYLGVDNGVVRLRLEGSCDGCAGSAATVRNAVERAVLDAAPDVTDVVVEGMVERTPSEAPLLQIGMRCPDGLVEAANS